MTNYGFRMLPLCHSERLLFVIPNAVRNLVRKRKEILRFALNDKRPNAEEHPPIPPFKGGKSGSGAFGKKASHLGGGLKSLT